MQSTGSDCIMITWIIHISLNWKTSFCSCFANHFSTLYIICLVDAG